MNLLAYQAKCAEIAMSAVAGEKPLIAAPEKKNDAPKVADIKDWEGVKGMPAPKPQMDLEGITWVLVDEIEILNKESEDKHIFTIKEAKDSYRSRQKLKYPDGTTVEDTGRAHVDGYSEFKVLNITPGRPVVVLRRMDYVYGDYELEMSVNGKKVGIVSCVGTDRVHRWRNWPAMIPAEARHRRHRCWSASSRSPPVATSTCSTSGSTSRSSAGCRDPRGRCGCERADEAYGRASTC